MDKDWMKTAHFLLVDDQQTNLELLQRVLKRAGFTNITMTTNPLQVEDICEKKEPDILLLDLHMPQMDGLTLLERIREIYPENTYLPIVMLTADVTNEAKKEALMRGASDFLTKPFQTMEVTLRMTNLLKTRYMYLQLQQQLQYQDRKIKERTEQLERAQVEMLRLLGRTSEFRDDDTGEHVQRVGELTALIAQKLNFNELEVDKIREAAQLHDIGKIGISDQVLLKPGRFTEEEMEQMKRHTLIGAQILENSEFSVLKLAKEIALTHHEKWNGNGYPLGLRGDEIPLSGRMVAIADFFDALTSKRPYKEPWTTEDALAEIKKQRGKHFDPQIVDIFLEIMNEKDV